MIILTVLENNHSANASLQYDIVILEDFSFIAVLYVFQLFWDELAKYFDEYEAAVHERRHGSTLYLPAAISVEDLRTMISERLPQDTPIPSNEWIRLQFCPSNPYAISALRYTGKFNMKFQVQRRQLRGSHVDAKYGTYQYRLLKCFALTNKANTTLVCMDDKAIVPVGEPDKQISSGVRAHNKSLVPANRSLEALDHDFHICGVVPSVCFFVNIPGSITDSFFNGEVEVVNKDKILQASNPFRHAAELLKSLRDSQCNEEGKANKGILAIHTDGGPDHRITYLSVQISLICLFVALDLDMLVAVRTAPQMSWINLAERIMSQLNLALQNVALAREEMPEQFEKRMKTLSSINQVCFFVTCSAVCKFYFACK